MVFGLQVVVFTRRSVISLVLIGAYFQTIFITSYSASEILGRDFKALSSFDLTIVVAMSIGVCAGNVNKLPAVKRKESIDVFGGAIQGLIS